MGANRAGRFARSPARKVTMPTLFDSLVSGDDERAESAIPAIVEMGAAAIPPLLELTLLPEPDSRWWAARALAALPCAKAEHFLPLLNDSAPEVRAAAALALSVHPDESAVPALVRALADEDSMTASLAANALVKIGKAAVDALLQSAQAANPSARILSLRALSEIGDHRAIPLFMKSLNEDSALLQYWAEVGLEKLGLDMVLIKP